MPEGFISTINDGATAGTFTGTLVNQQGHHEVDFTDQPILTEAGVAITDKSECDLDSGVRYDNAPGGKAQNCKRFAQVIMDGTVDSNTNAQVRSVSKSFGSDGGTASKITISRG